MTVRAYVVVSLLLLPIAGTDRAVGAEPDLEFAADEADLVKAKIATDGPGLVAYFRRLTPTEAVRQRILANMQRLGSPSYARRQKATREINAAGRVALPFLRAALNDADPETAARAQRCLEAIEQTTDATVVAAAARLLASRRPASGCQVLLGYLPCADKEMVEEAVLEALATVSLQGSKVDPAILGAVADKQPICRVAAALVLGKVAVDHRRELGRLLKDTDARTRFHAAVALLSVGDRSAGPPLIALLSEGPRPLAWQAEDLLYRLADDLGPAPVLGVDDPAARRQWRAAWEKWWQENAARVDLARLRQGGAYRGLTLVCEGESGPTATSDSKVWECGRDGKVRWQMSGLHSPNDIQLLPAGRVLVAEYWGLKVTERNRQGKIFWEYKLPSGPVTAQRLPGGNTFLATYTEVLEVTRAGKKVFSFTVPGSIYCAQKLRNGHIVYIKGSGDVGELDAKGKEVVHFNIGASPYWAGIEVLPTGHYLIAHHGGNRVIEVDQTGKIIWTLNTPGPTWATRLPTGHTPVVNNQQKYLAEFDRAGKEVWRKTTTYRPFRARRY